MGYLIESDRPDFVGPTAKSNREAAIAAAQFVSTHEWPATVRDDETGVIVAEVRTIIDWAPTPGEL